MALEFVRSRQRLELEVEVNRLHFLDRDALLGAIDRKAVHPPGDGDVPSAALGTMDDVHFRAVVRVLVRAQLRAARMNVLPEPHPPEAVAALDADAAVRRFVDQVADGA